MTRQANGHSTVLKLEGALREGWLEEFTTQVYAAREGGRALKLDLADVTFVDAAAAGLLRHLLNDHVELASCSGFVAASLGLETP
jgi:anti-anti-sigma regulatory factor